MISHKAGYTAALCGLLAGCGPSQGEGLKDSGKGDLGDLPYLLQNGVKYRYTRYVESTGKGDSKGRVFFVYPIKRRKNELLELEYSPGAKVENLFGEDLMGSVGEVIVADKQVRVSFIPVSVPIGIRTGQGWRMSYVNIQFACKSSGRRSFFRADVVEVSCTGSTYTLTYAFSRDKGIVEFQDFCGNAICTYKLIDSEGVASAAMNRLMRLPSI